MIDAGGVAARLTMDGSQYFETLKKADKETKTFEQKLNSHGDKMQKVGGKLTKTVTFPIVALGAAAIKAGSDFEEGMSEVQAISGATGEDLLKLSTKAKEMGAKTKFSATESAEAFKYMAMAGWDTEQMLDGITGVMSLAAASGESLALVSDIVTDALTAFGMEAKEAGKFADLLAKASSNSNTNVALLGESFKFVAPIFGAAGYSAESAALALGLMANAGIKGGQAGTTLRSAVTNLIKPTDEAAKLIKKLGLEVSDAEGNMVPFDDVMKQLRESFKDLSEEQQMQYASTIFGQQAMSGMLAIVNASESDFEKLTKATTNYNGAAEEMAAIMQDNLKGKIVILKSQLEGVGIQIAEILIPILGDFVEKLGKLVDWFAGLDEGTQKTIIQLAAFAAVGGPALKVTGKLTSGIGTLTGWMLKLGGSKGAAAAASTAMTGTTASTTALTGAAKVGIGTLGGWALGIGVAGTAAYGLYKHLKKEVIPEVDIFGDSVSEATKEAVGGFLELEREATNSLNQMLWSGSDITEEMTDKIVGEVTKMSNEVTEKYEQQKEEALASLSEMFANSKDMTEQEKADMIKITEEKYDKMIDVSNKSVSEIENILRTASKENRKLTQEEKDKIIKIKEEMKEDGIKLLSETQRESETILRNLKNNSERLTTEMASEVLQNSIKQKESTIQQAEEEYQRRLKFAEELKGEGSKESKDLANKVIEEAERQKKETVKEAEDMHFKVLRQISKQGNDIINKLDLDNGKIKTNWQKLTTWFNNNPIVRKIKEITENAVANNKKVPRYATGTSYHPGGLAIVGEQGRELVDLPRGSKVYTNSQTDNMLNQKQNLSLKLEVPFVLNGKEFQREIIELTAEELDKYLEGRSR